jgi:GNAT superfamily N-acetyltransferase
MLPDHWKIVLLPSEIKRIAAVSSLPPSQFVDSTPLSAKQIGSYADDDAIQDDPMWARLFFNWKYPYGIKNNCPFLTSKGCHLPYRSKPFICRVHPLGFNLTTGTLYSYPDGTCPIAREQKSIEETAHCFHDNIASLEQALTTFRDECLSLIQTIEHLTVRAMTAEDKPPVMQMLKNIPEFLPPEVAVAEEVIDSYLRDEQAGYYILVAHNGHQVMGYICYGPTPLTQGAWDVYWLAITPSLQGRGLGGILLSWAENCIREAGGRLALIETSGKPEYTKTIRFYCDQGWQEICRVPDFYAPHDDKLILQKRLQP